MDERGVLWLNFWFIGVNHEKELCVEIERHGGGAIMRVRAVNLNPASHCGFSGVISVNPRSPSLHPNGYSPHGSCPPISPTEYP